MKSNANESTNTVEHDSSLSSPVSEVVMYEVSEVVKYEVVIALASEVVTTEVVIASGKSNLISTSL